MYRPLVYSPSNRLQKIPIFFIVQIVAIAFIALEYSPQIGNKKSYSPGAYTYTVCSSPVGYTVYLQNFMVVYNLMRLSYFSRKNGADPVHTDSRKTVLRYGETEYAGRKLENPRVAASEGNVVMHFASTFEQGELVSQVHGE